MTPWLEKVQRTLSSPQPCKTAAQNYKILLPVCRWDIRIDTWIDQVGRTAGWMFDVRRTSSLSTSFDLWEWFICLWLNTNQRILLANWSGTLSKNQQSQTLLFDSEGARLIPKLYCRSLAHKTKATQKSLQ